MSESNEKNVLLASNVDSLNQKLELVLQKLDMGSEKFSRLKLLGKIIDDLIEFSPGDRINTAEVWKKVNEIAEVLYKERFSKFEVADYFQNNNVTRRKVNGMNFYFDYKFL